MARDSDGLSYTRRRIQKQMEQVEKEKKSQLHKKRMELAGVGARAMKARKFQEGVQAFLTYLRMLEASKGVNPGGLVPSLFDKKMELGEMVLVSGIYWDLAKTFDRSKSPQKYKEFTQYLEKFVLFSLGMPYEAVCRELLRKYLRNDKPIHAKDFREVYRRMAGTKCFVATSLVDVTEYETLDLLRRLRDRKLLRSKSGRIFIWGYYKTAPFIVKILDASPTRVRVAAGRLVDFIARLSQDRTNSTRSK